MIKFLIVRHGNSVSNIAKTFTGHIDAPLSEIGYKQAQLVSEYIYNNFKVDKICSSDLTRAVDTIKPLADKLGLEIFKRKDMREMFGGEWEGKLFADLPVYFENDYKVWQQTPGLARPTGGESYAEVQARSLSVINDLYKTDDGKTVVIATHGGFIRTLQCAANNVKLVDMNTVPYVVNASVSIVEYDGKNLDWKDSISDYLGELQTAMPKGV